MRVPTAPTWMHQASLRAADGSRRAARCAATRTRPSSAQFIYRPDALLVRGTYIRCVLETRIITDIPGFTSCVVTEPIYSINGRSLLLPKGSKMSGRYNNAGANGPRVAVIWDRITTPNGIDVSMASPGVDNLGGAGHPGDYNAHWGSRIASALMISLISDAFSYAAAENGPPTTTITNGTVLETPFESTTARTMERLANQALDKSINRPAHRHHQPGHGGQRLCFQGRGFHRRAGPQLTRAMTAMDIDDSPVARVSNEFLEYQYEVLGILEYMSSPDVTEICINRPGEIYLETRQGWQRVEVPASELRARAPVLHRGRQRKQYRAAHHRYRSGGVADLSYRPTRAVRDSAGLRRRQGLHHHPPAVQAHQDSAAVPGGRVLRPDPGAGPRPERPRPRIA